MTDLEQEVEKKLATKVVRPRERTRDAVPQISENLFSAKESTSQNISYQLQDFDNKYKPLDLTAIFKDIKQNKEETVTVVKEIVEAKPANKPVYNDDSEFVNVTKLPSGTLAQNYEFEVPTEYKEEKFTLKLNLRGKLILMVCSVVFLCLLFLSIFNGISIRNINKDIDALNTQIATESTLLEWMNQQYNLITDETTLINRAKNAGFDETDPANIVEFSLLEEAATTAKETNQNWFDAFCNFISRLFGG